MLAVNVQEEYSNGNVQAALQDRKVYRKSLAIAFVRHGDWDQEDPSVSSNSASAWPYDLVYIL